MTRRAVRPLSCCAALLALAACSPRASEMPGDAAAAADSIVLERTPCFGFCPTYRLSIARDGVVRFQSRNRGDSTAATDTVEATVLATLAAQAARIPLESLPDTVARDSVLCALRATDHPSIVVSLFGARPKRVDYYTGCRAADRERAPALEALTRLAEAIDSAAGASRWVQPNRTR